ncbi:hypothetical protein G4B88_014479 [Cannabis sativa]|uniref:Uncharacterized protein n=1 Tax=Cannabis sativa TaxID=3483 RepID=A0A7J6I8Z8_CANSA|nr:hypothetical protein G4B88_014479 [Cannabis sativa]
MKLGLGSKPKSEALERHVQLTLQSREGDDQCQELLSSVGLLYYYFKRRQFPSTWSLSVSHAHSGGAFQRVFSPAKYTLSPLSPLLLLLHHLLLLRSSVFLYFSLPQFLSLSRKTELNPSVYEPNNSYINPIQKKESHR